MFIIASLWLKNKKNNYIVSHNDLEKLSIMYVLIWAKIYEYYRVPNCQSVFFKYNYVSYIFSKVRVCEIFFKLKFSKFIQKIRTLESVKDTKISIV